MTKSRYTKARRALLFWTLFIGIGAVAGATGMFSDPTGKTWGMDALLGLQNSPVVSVCCRKGKYLSRKAHGPQMSVATNEEKGASSFIKLH